MRAKGRKGGMKGGGKQIKGGMLSKLLQLQNPAYFSERLFQVAVSCNSKEIAGGGKILSANSFQSAVFFWSKFVLWFTPPLSSWGVLPGTSRRPLGNPELP